MQAQPNEAVEFRLDDSKGWVDYPPEPGQIIEGEPRCRIKLIRTIGAATPMHRASLIDISPGKFRWRFAGDESWIVLQGRCVITLDNGRVLDCAKGHLGSVPAGHDSVWDVTEHFVKFVVNTSARAERT